jgi:hypothetical protein
MKPELFAGSPVLAPGAGSVNRELLGLGGHTFFWVGRMSYDPAPLVLVWESAAERTVPPDGHCAPWDTGGLLTHGTLGTNPTLEDALTTLDRYSLPLGEYRDYLSLVIETCFEEPADYRNGQPRRWYPGRMTRALADISPPAHTFELRRAGPVPIQTGLVAAIVDEPWFAEKPGLLRDLRKHVKQLDAAWRSPRQGESVQTAAARYVEEYLRLREVL